VFAVVLEVDPATDQSGAQPPNPMLLKLEREQIDGFLDQTEQPRWPCSRRAACYCVRVVAQPSADAEITVARDEDRKPGPAAPRRVLFP
jgi:hypothetical protein